jgi:uncharacterized membrane protein
MKTEPGAVATLEAAPCRTQLPGTGLGRDAVLLACLTALALALRLLGRGLESLWYDEAASLEIAGWGARQLLTGRQFDTGNPAGYFALLSGWLGLWGGSIENARALSALAGALTVPAVWALAWAVEAPRRAAWLACLLVAVSPPLVYLGQEARVFALFAVVTTLTAAAAARIQRTDRPAAWLAFAVCGAVLVHLQYYAAFVLLALGLDLLFWAWPRGWRPVLRLVGATALVVLAFAPYLPVLRQQLALGSARSSETWWQHLALLPSFSVVGRTLVWKQHGLALVGAVALLVAVAVYLPALWLLVRRPAYPRSSPPRVGWTTNKRPLLALALGVPILVGALALAGTPMIHAHYLSAVFPALMLLLAWGLDTGLAARSRLVWLPIVCLVVLVPPALARVYLVRHKTDWRGLATLVGQKDGEVPVYFYEDLGSLPFAYYRGEQPRRLIVKPFDQDGTGWERSGDLTAMRGERGGFWFVFYATNSRTIAEEEAIVARLRREWTVEEAGQFAPLRALRCRPR